MLQVLSNQGGVFVGSASPLEVTLVEKAPESRFTEGPIRKRVDDEAYDSDPLDKKLAREGDVMCGAGK